MESYKQNLQHFEGPNADNDSIVKTMSQDQLNNYNTYVSRANNYYAQAKLNGIPKDYQDYFKIMKEDMKRVNVGIDLNYEEIYALDTAFTRTIWDMDHYSQIGITTKSMTVPKWQEKGYRVSSHEWPRATREFNNVRFLRISQADGFTDGFGIYMGITMSWQQIKENGGGLWDPLAVLNQQGAEKFGLIKSRIGFRGYDAYNLQGDDGRTPSYVSATGLLNHSSAQAFQGGAGSDEDLTAGGDVHVTIKNALALFDKVYQPHKKILITSRGVASETILESHRDTYAQKSDLARIYESYFATGMIDGWFITDQVYNGTTPANTAQDMYLVGVGPMCQHDTLVYPLQKLTMNDKKFAGDYRECMIWGRINTYKQADTTNNAFPLAAVAAACTTTDTGSWIPQGWFNPLKYLGMKAATGLQ
jgi:hypothetical protein